MSKIKLIPLNCGGSKGMNSFSTFEKSEFDNTTSRSVLFFEPTSSIFQMYSVNGEAYLDPMLFDTNGGDEIIIRFKARKLINSNTQVKIWLGEMFDNYTTEIIDSTSYQIDINDSYFNEYKIKLIATNKYPDKRIGTLLNIRCALKGKIEIRDIEIEVNSSNSLFNLKNNFYFLDNDEILKTCINQQVKNNVFDYSNPKKELNNGITIVNSEFVAKSNTDGFKGIGIKLNNRKHTRSIIPVYIEYIKNGGEFRIGVSHRKNSSNVVDLEVMQDSNTYKRKIIYMQSTVESVSYLGLEVGSPRTVDFKFKNLIINHYNFGVEQNNNLYYITNSTISLENSL